MEILFDSELKRHIIDDRCDVDAENYILMQKQNKVIAFDGSELTIDEFGGVKKVH